MTDRYIESEYRVWAEEVPAKGSQDGFYFIGRYALPGYETNTVRLHEADTRTVFSTDAQACAAAGVALCERLNKRSNSRDTRKTIKLSGNELAAALGRLGLTRSEFAALFGTNEERVNSWIDGAADIPHPARLLLACFSDRAALEMCRQITATVSVDSRDIRFVPTQEAAVIRTKQRGLG